MLVDHLVSHIQPNCVEGLTEARSFILWSINFFGGIMTRLVALALFGVVAPVGVAVAAGKYDGHFGDIDKNGSLVGC